LKGISGVSGDLRQILSDIDKGNERAKLAFDMYVHSLRKHIGAMLASLGGLDALVFTGGVGENSSAIRAAACEAFEFLGLKLDSRRMMPHLLIRILQQQIQQFASSLCKLKKIGRSHRNAGT
jgi:acetate kinase